MTAGRVALPADEVHVWRASLDQPADVVRGLEILLSSDERERADAFHFERDRSRFVIGRGVLRKLLGHYAGVAPNELVFRYGEFHKPELDGDGPRFNVSHSGPFAMFAFSASVELGIDVEQTPAPPGLDGIARRFFSPGEVAELSELPVAERELGFLRCWTRKEAFVKARGDGLTLPLDMFDVTLGRARPCRLLRTAWSAEEPGEWRLVDLSDPGGGYLAALAARDHGWRVVACDLPTALINTQLPQLLTPLETT